MDIRVGDLVTYKNSMGNIRQVVIKDEEQKIKYINNVDTYKKILKIERPHYEVVEEKKELLTEEEREFLKDICKYYKDISLVSFKVEAKVIILHNKNFYAMCSIDYPDSMKFDNIKKDNNYTLQELGLEEN